MGVEDQVEANVRLLERICNASVRIYNMLRQTASALISTARTLAQEGQRLRVGQQAVQQQLMRM